MGRQDLIAAARLNGPPNSDAIGRGMKVNKEEYLGMMVAIELYVKIVKRLRDGDPSIELRTAWKSRSGCYSRAKRRLSPSGFAKC
jgi:seryl-tRNA(Sec) selenium transferase